jgi:hypothetical protein
MAASVVAPSGTIQNKNPSDLGGSYATACGNSAIFKYFSQAPML